MDKNDPREHKKSDKNNENQDFSENEKLLNSFLNNVRENISRNNQPDPAPVDPLQGIYDEIEMTDEIVKKIDRLQKIARQIEDKYIEQEEIILREQNFHVNYKNNLNKSQLLAVSIIKGPVLVIAGAGSGKTRVLVHRVSYMLECGVPPSEILLLTFTRKAAKEMLGRVKDLVKDYPVGEVAGGTFHSFATHMLKKYANMLGLHPSFTIMDMDDAADTVDLIRSELKFDNNDVKFPRKKRLIEIISSSKNRDISISRVVEKDFSGLKDYIKDIELIARGYDQYKKISNIFDYDDLMEVLHKNLKINKSFRKKIEQTYKFILVDEYQDTNIIQKKIVDLIAGDNQNIMVVGDDAQSIYAFRGANYENILTFPETYPNCKVIKIQQNYRSHQAILDFTNDIIKHSKIGYRKTLYSIQKGTVKPQIRKFYSQQEEAEFIVDKIMELREKGIPAEKISVLYRATWHGDYIQTELLGRNIPYVVVGGIKFSERLHVKDYISYLRLVVNPSDAVAWNRVLKLIPGIGKVTASNIIKNVKLKNGLIDFSDYDSPKHAIELSKLADALNEARDSSKGLQVQLSAIRNYYLPILEPRVDDFNQRANDIHVFIDMSSKYKDLDTLLVEFSLEPPSKNFQDRNTPLTDEEEEGSITLSTVHSAKGLEWYAVFIPYALDGLFPSVRAMKNIEELEEERRLFYVACSRAREELYITMPAYVSSYNAYFSYPSRFLAEVDKSKYILN